MYYQRNKKIGIVEIIIIINVVLFVLPRFLAFILANNFFINLFYGLFALHINKDFIFTINNGAFWQLLTSIFLHGDFMHIFFNMFALYVFGKILEENWGKMKFLLLHIAPPYQIYSMSQKYKSNLSIPPLGILYIGKSLEDEGHQVEVIDCNYEQKPQIRIKQVINSVDAVGINVNSFIFKEVAQTAKWIKEQE